MTALERRLTKLEEGLNQLQGRTHHVWLNEGEEHQPPPDFQFGDEIVYIRWETDEDSPGTE